MRYHKTPSISKKKKEELQAEMLRHPEKRNQLRKKDPRSTYKLYDEDKAFQVEFDPETDFVYYPKIEGESGITIKKKEWIVAEMHKIDDAEVRVNCKENRAPEYMERLIRKEIERRIEEFKAKYGYIPHPDDLPKLHRTFVYIDGITQDEGEEGSEMGDSSQIQLALSNDPFEEEMDAVEYMRYIIEGFTHEERMVFELKYQIGVRDKANTNEFVAKEMGCTRQKVGETVKRIKEKLSQNKGLSRYFRNAPCE